MRRLLLWLAFGNMRVQPRGVVVRQIEHALRTDDLGLSRREASAVAHRVMETLVQLGFRF